MNNKRYGKLLILGIVTAMCVAGVFFVIRSDFFNATSSASPTQIDPTDDAVLDTSATLGSEYGTYKNIKYGFSVEYPKELTLVAYDEGDDAETIVFKSSTGNKRDGFQIFVYPFDEEIEVLTPERIREDLPFASMEDLQEVIIAGGIRALLFWSNDPDVGKTREVWFVYEGYLYQVTTFAELDEWLAMIMSTWRFMNQGTSVSN